MKRGRLRGPSWRQVGRVSCGEVWGSRERACALGARLGVTPEDGGWRWPGMGKVGWARSGMGGLERAVECPGREENSPGVDQGG